MLLDLGAEHTGPVELVTPMTKDKQPPRVRVRFGESGAEAMAELGGEPNAQNDHALRDQVVHLPWLGMTTVEPSGFRYVRSDNVGPGLPAHLNMQDYLWDGVKHDRLGWIGDMQPEVATINAVFGFNTVEPRASIHGRIASAWTVDQGVF